LNDAGIFSKELEDRTVQFATGDVMLFITDGVTEARNAAGEEYGDERVMKAVQSHAGSGATAIRDALIEDVRQFGTGMEQHDDQTVVVVRAV
jgi:sigma-B regulation protein RsbU (phosphoserine phosphatase)